MSDPIARRHIGKFIAGSARQLVSLLQPRIRIIFYSIRSNRRAHGTLRYYLSLGLYSWTRDVLEYDQNRILRSLIQSVWRSAELCSRAHAAFRHHPTRTKSICIAMLYDDRAAAYGRLAEELNRNYARLHRYSFVVAHETLDKARSTAWSKVRFVRQLIAHYDYVVWIDADAAFIGSAPPLESLVDMYPDANLLISTCDYWGAIVCTGCFLVQRSNATIEMLDSWYSQPSEDDHVAVYTTRHDWEQRILIRLLQRRIPSAQIVVLPGAVFNAHPLNSVLPSCPITKLSYVIHASGMSDEDRLRVLQAVASGKANQMDAATASAIEHV
jgi:hypothetical protein